MASRRLTRLELENFTAFEKLDMRFSPGVNVFVGGNATGKTHVLKVLYAACDITLREDDHFAAKLLRVFKPYPDHLGRLSRRRGRSVNTNVLVHAAPPRKSLRLAFSNHTKEPLDAHRFGRRDWLQKKIKSVYIPVKEMLANAPGFLSLNTEREIYFEEIYPDVITRAFGPRVKPPLDDKRTELLDLLARSMGGRVVAENEYLFLKGPRQNLEFMLLAEGYRKLGLLWLLLQNGTLAPGSILFWDEPEANLNPNRMGIVVEIILALSKLGVQSFLATHDYVLLKEFDLQSSNHAIRYHSFFRDKKNRNEISVQSTDDYDAIHPNAILDAFGDLYNRQVDRALK